MDATPRTLLATKSRWATRALAILEQEPPIGLSLSRPGYCNLCGRPTLFLALRPRREGRREDLFCLFCWSRSRDRHVAKEILLESPGRGRSIREWGGGGLVILNAGSDEAFIRCLGMSGNFYFCERFPGIPPGTPIAGNRASSQNLEALTYASDFFDLVITEDVLEHVRDYRKALAEISRVLRPEGLHVFTVPYNPAEPTKVRVDTSGDEDRLLEPEYHLSPFGPCLAYRTFGRDLIDELDTAGFVTRVSLSSRADAREGIADSSVFVSRKG
jgi:SAM-dependent methyltransferase